VGDALSLADIMLAPHLDFFAATPEWPALTAKSANLIAWLRRMNVRPSLEATTWERVSAMALASSGERPVPALHSSSSLVHGA
jgi:glutathione S-transferase